MEAVDANLRVLAGDLPCGTIESDYDAFICLTPLEGKQGVKKEDDTGNIFSLRVQHGIAAECPIGRIDKAVAINDPKFFDVLGVSAGLASASVGAGLAGVGWGILHVSFSPSA